MMRLGCAALILTLGILAGANLRRKWMRSRKTELTIEATQVFNAAREASASMPKPRLATPNVWKDLQAAQKVQGKLQEFEIKQIGVPFLGVSEDVVVKTRRKNRTYHEVLIRFGSSFNSHQFQKLK